MKTKTFKMMMWILTTAVLVGACSPQGGSDASGDAGSKTPIATNPSQPSAGTLPILVTTPIGIVSAPQATVAIPVTVGQIEETNSNPAADVISPINLVVAYPIVSQEENFSEPVEEVSAPSEVIVVSDIASDVISPVQKILVPQQEVLNPVSDVLVGEPEVVSAPFQTAPESVEEVATVPAVTPVQEMVSAPIEIAPVQEVIAAPVQTAPVQEVVAPVQSSLVQEVVTAPAIAPVQNPVVAPVPVLTPAPVSSVSDDLDENEETDVVVEGSCLKKKKVAVIWFHKNHSDKKKSNTIVCKNDRFKTQIKLKKSEVALTKIQTAYLD